MQHTISSRDTTTVISSGSNSPFSLQWPFPVLSPEPLRAFSSDGFGVFGEQGEIYFSVGYVQGSRLSSSTRRVAIRWTRRFHDWLLASAPSTPYRSSRATTPTAQPRTRHSGEEGLRPRQTFFWSSLESAPPLGLASISREMCDGLHRIAPVNEKWYYRTLRRRNRTIGGTFASRLSVTYGKAKVVNQVEARRKSDSGARGYQIVTFIEVKSLRWLRITSALSSPLNDR